MRVAIDKGPLTSGHKVRGIGVHTRELIEELEKILKRRKKLTIKPIDFEKANLAKYDLVHYPYFHPYFLTLPTSKPTKAVVTIHDLIPLIYPKNYPPGLKGKLRYYFQKYLIKNIDAVITISETSKKDIVRFLGVPQEKIHVIYLAPRKIFKILSSKNLNLIRSKYSLPTKFVLYVGDVNYNKNIPGLIKACKVAKLPLVICGKQALDIEDKGLGLPIVEGPRDWIRFLFDIPHPELAHYGSLLDYFRNDKKIKILRLGFVPDEDLVAIYNLATVYCQPSFYEGFGLPVLEAMACEVPVVASKTQALVEIAENAAVFFDPKDSRDLAEKLKEVAQKPSLRSELIRKGKEKVKEYSWEKAARETIKVYQKVLEK